MDAAPSRRIPFLPQAEHDQDLHALLDVLPEVEPKEPLPFSPVDAVDAPSGDELALFLDTLQAETQVFVTAQFSRLQAELARQGGSSDEVDEARETIADLRQQNARLLRQLDLYERAFRSLKELAIDVEEASQ